MTTDHSATDTTAESDSVPQGSLSGARRQLLVERRDFLLKSIDDLEAEHAAGDMSDADFDLLHRDYSRRAAEVLRELEFGSAEAPSAARPAGNSATHAGNEAVRRAIAKRSPWFKAAAAASIVAFALAAGVLVAQLAGERSSSGGPTGTIKAAAANTTDAKVQQLMQTGRDNMAADPLTSIKAFDQAFALDPTQTEALTYSGWVLRIVSTSVTDPANKKELVDRALERINHALAIDPKYADARAFHGIISLRDLNDPKTALADFTMLDASTIPPQVSMLIGNAKSDAQAAVNAMANGASPATTTTTSALLPTTAAS